jgi:hypothetical protein
MGVEIKGLASALLLPPAPPSKDLTSSALLADDARWAAPRLLAFFLRRRSQRARPRRAIRATIPIAMPAMAPPEIGELLDLSSSLEPAFLVRFGERMDSTAVVATLFESQAQGATVKVGFLEEGAAEGVLSVVRGALEREVAGGCAVCCKRVGEGEVEGGVGESDVDFITRAVHKCESEARVGFGQCIVHGVVDKVAFQLAVVGQIERLLEGIARRFG